MNTGMSKYNIDAFRKDDGSYRLADRRTVKGALNTKHVTHLSRMVDDVTSTVAMRLSEGEFGPLYTLDFSNRTCEQTSILSKAIDMVMDYLNKGEHGYKYGMSVGVWSNQAQRDATVLAVLDDEILVEYEMPGTTSQYGYNRRTCTYTYEARPTSALVMFKIVSGERRGSRNYSYNKVPKKWIAAVREQYGDWIGMGQRMIEPLPFPAE